MTTRFITRWLVPLALATLAWGLYLTTLSQVHTFDALSYIRDADQRAGFFFHPHHLLYTPTGWLFWQGWRVFGYSGNSELPLKVLNSLVGAACGFGLYRLVLRLTGKWWAALTTAGLLLFSYGAWYFSVEVEVYILALAWLLALLFLLIELIEQPRRRTAPLIGLSLGIAALYHQTNGLFIPVVVAAVVLSPWSWRERFKQLVVIGALAGSLVAAGYLLIGFGYNGYRSLGQLRDWMFFFVSTGWWGHATHNRWTDLGIGLGNSMSTQAALPFWIGVVLLLIWGLPTAIRRWPRISALCGVWLLVYAAFFIYWEPENIEFWIATLIPLWVMVGLSVSQLRIPPWTFRQPQPRQRFGLVAVALPLILAWHNYPIVERRGDPNQDLDRELAVLVQQTTAPIDMIVPPGGTMELYLPYYVDRHNVHPLNGKIFEADGDIPLAFAQLREKIDQSVTAGLAVLVSREARELQSDIYLRYPITQPQLDAFWEPYRAAFEPIVIHKGTTYYWRIPAATTVAERDGWKWSGFRWGWEGLNIGQVSDGDGWCFDPQPDPILLSPVLNLPAERFKALEVTLTTQATDQVAQLFYAGPDGSMNGERMVQWPVEGDGQPHTYTIALTDAPGWQGSITRLRLDPIAVGDGTAASRTCVRSLRLVR